MELSRRQYLWYGDTTSWELKWAVFGGIVFLIFVVFFVAYSHARSRIRQGKQPLKYHAWLVRSQPGSHYIPSRDTYQEQYYPAYPLNTLNTNQPDLAPPPPAYDPRYPAPPQYSSQSTDVKPAYQAESPNYGNDSSASSSNGYQAGVTNTYLASSGPTPGGIPLGQAHNNGNDNNNSNNDWHLQTNGGSTAYRYA
ncbi:hypothetical protein V1514DRAFT_323384 [Lipomyces japonicus]|uniref:uncharacterized protein n=1 Tax=Lipomyces japonicus TaxID=56871 RepID=UPI0034CDE725